MKEEDDEEVVCSPRIECWQETVNYTRDIMCDEGDYLHFDKEYCIGLDIRLKRSR